MASCDHFLRHSQVWLGILVLQSQSALREAVINSSDWQIVGNNH